MIDPDVRLEGDVAEAIEAIRASRKYRDVSPQVIERIVRVEMDHRSDPRKAEKAARAKLHQIGGAYLPGRLQLDRALDALRDASQAEDLGATRQACLQMMSRHASTRERIPELETFYAAIREAVGPVDSVADLACGLNPLAAPWMGLAQGATYHAYDMYSDLTSFVNQALPLIGVRAEAVACDVLTLTPPQVDLALILKTLPCLEQLEPGCSPALLDKVRARHLVISYPTRSLGRHEKGMLATYERRFWELASGRPWRVQRLIYASELAFLVTVQGD